MVTSSPLSRDQQVLILYGTKYGQTEKIANRIATVLRECNCSVDLVRVTKNLKTKTLDRYGAVLVGSPVFTGKHLKSVRRWVTEHQQVLQEMPGAFFSVSGAAAGSTTEEKNEAEEHLSHFFEQTGWHPPLYRGFGGGHAFSKYNWLIRFITVRVLRKQGKQVDPKQDIEMTDWNAVDEFAAAVVRLLAERAAGAMSKIA